MQTFWQDLRYGARMLLKNPGVTAVAVITLALGIGATTAIFSVVNAVLLRSLPFQQPDRLVKVWTQKPPTTVSKAEFVEIRNNNHSFDDLAAYSGWSFTLTGRDEPAKLDGARTTATFFSLLGVKAALGRTFLPDEDQPGHSDVVLLSYGSWESRFGSDQNIVGQKITVDGVNLTIVGVLPRDFKFPDNGVSKLGRELIVPAPLDPRDENDFTAGYLNVIGRLKQVVTPEQAQAEVITIASNARVKFPRSPDNYGLAAVVRPLQQELVGDTRLLILVLLGAVGFVLLIACANVANLQLARTTARKREIATRVALGAGRERVIRQLLTESVMLSMLGAVVGVPLALWGIDLLISFLPAEMPRLNEIRLDLRIFGFAFGLSLLTGMLVGLAPALQISKADLQTALKESGRGTAGAGGRFRNALVVAEVSLTLMLLIGAGLLLKSFWRLRQVDPGFKAENVLSMQLAPPVTVYSEAPRKRAFYGQVIERIKSLPGVNAVGAIHLLPMGGRNWNPKLTVEDHPLPPGAELPSVDWRLITPGYFQAMGIRLVKGRWFTESDNEKAPKVAVINETLARKYWPNDDPIEKQIKSGFEGKNWASIVGVVGDVKEQGLELPTHLEMYRPYEQVSFPSSLILMVRTEADPTALAVAIRKEVWSVDKDVPIADLQPLTQVISESLAARRSTMLLLAAFAGLALLLGAVGIYGVMSYAVTQRTNEIGIRMALGAQTRDVLKLVVRNGMTLTLIGVGVGLAGALALTRLMTSLLFGVAPTDAATFMTVSVGLIVVALLACYLPARRATKVDPLVALRYE